MLANVVWPALVLTVGWLHWQPICIGLVIEYVYVRYILDMAIKQSIVADLAANVVSGVAGFFLIPISGILWELLATFTVNQIAGWGTFNPISWIVTTFLAASMNAFLEALVYRYYFGVSLPYKSKRFLWLILANLVSVGIAFFYLPTSF